MQIKRLHFKTIPSTNTWAKENAHSFDKNSLTLVTADSQTQGRGRFKRSWVSPEGGNLYATYVFFIEKIDESIGNIPQLLALSIYEVLLPICSKIRLKWPNDLVICEKKLGGILCELTEIEGDYAVVIGIGLNINTPLDVLNKIDRPATSLSEELGKTLDSDSLSESIHLHFKTLLEQFFKEGFSPFLEGFKNALIHQKGDQLRFHNFQNIVEGRFEEIQSDGSLILKLKNGELKRCTSGELV